MRHKPAARGVRSRSSVLRDVGITSYQMFKLVGRYILRDQCQQNLTPTFGM